MTAASTATKLLTDNRTVVGGKDDLGVRIAVLPTLPDGMLFVAKDAVNADITGETAATPTVPAYISNATVDKVIVPIDFATVNTGITGTGSKYVRKQLFRYSTQPVSGFLEKWCYTNSLGQPLAADGTVTTPALAANALTTPLSAVGSAVTSWFQPGPIPATYQVSERQMGSAPYIGWTVKQSTFGG